MFTAGRGGKGCQAMDLQEAGACLQVQRAGAGGPLQTSAGAASWLLHLGRAGALPRCRESSPSGRLFVDEACPILLVLSLGHPHLLEGSQGGEDAPPDPHAVPPLRLARGAHHLHRGGGWGSGSGKGVGGGGAGEGGTQWP